MADFSNFKVGSTSYNVKDAAAGKSLSISGDQLSLLKADGTAASTVTIPSGTIHTVEVRYTDTTVTGQASDAATLMKAGTGTWSVTITPALPAGKTLFDVNRVFNGFCYFPNADSGYQNHLLFNTELNNNYPTFLVENDNGNHSVGAIVTVFVASDGSYVMDWGWTDLSSGGGSSYTPNMICGISVDTSGNLRGFDIAGYRPISVVEGNASLMVRVALFGTTPAEFVDCIPAGVKIKDSNNYPYASWETFNAAYPSGGYVNLDLYLVGLLSSGIVKISISGYVSDGILDNIDGNTAIVTSIQRIGQ